MPDGTPGVRNHFSSHWKGELPLLISVWVNGVFVSLALAVLLVTLPWGEFMSRAPKTTALTALLLFPVGCAVVTWQFTGVWRSAARYIRDGKSKIWGRAAQLAVVVSVIGISMELVNVGALALLGGQLFKIAFGGDPIGTYHLRALRSGTELELDGPIAFGVTDAVEKALDANPTVTTIRLNSSGGRVDEGRRLGRLIASRRLTTVTTDSCLSACTFAFLGGKRRLIAKDARLGFHRYVYPPEPPADLEARYEKDKQDWLERGVSKSIVDRAFATPSNEMWLPTETELRDGGVVNGYAAP